MARSARKPSRHLSHQLSPTSQVPVSGGTTPLQTLLFSAKALTIRSAPGLAVLAANVLTTAATAVATAAVVKRSKKCLDFAASAYAAHGLACWAVGGWPGAAPTWWLTNALGAAAAAGGAEWLCLQQELRDIPLGAAIRRAAAAAALGVRGAAVGAGGGSGGGGGGSGSGGAGGEGKAAAQPALGGESDGSGGGGGGSGRSPVRGGGAQQQQLTPRGAEAV